MIKSLRVKNFLSLRDVELELHHRNVLIGPNMSGKSNLIDALKFLGQLATTGLRDALFVNRGGHREVAWKGADDPVISLGVTLELKDENSPPRIFDYDVSITGSLVEDRVAISSEKLTVSEDGGKRSLLSMSNAEGQADYGQGLKGVRVQAEQTGLEAYSIPGSDLALVRTMISSCRFYHLIPQLMRRGNAPTPQRFLDEIGTNFASWMMTLQTSPDEFKRISSVAGEVLPGLGDLLIQPSQAASVSISAREKFLKRPVSMLRMSDGELAFLALLSVILAPPELGAPLFCIEEPESHLHPRLLETLIEVLDQRQQELGPHAAQIIATTHSPLLVDKLRIEDLLVVEKSDGESKFSRPCSDRHLQDLLKRKELGLGDLWYSGALSST
ncbi:MAG TPA: AAA family ATPase [Candidatus Binataceae bacterium]|nr:AAA family ATPase [Candidatus Binataceae bacterium]